MIRAWILSLATAAGRLRGSTHGGVALIGALSLTTIVGMGAFAVEATRGYAADVQNQRIADMAALAGALAYNVNSSTSAMTATAKAVVVAQGLPATAADVQLVTDAATSRQLVQVTVTTAVPLALGRVFTSALSYDVSAVGSATTTATVTTAPPCIAALDGSPTYGITMDGGTTLSAPGCAINTNAGITVPWGTYISAKQANAGKAVNNPGNGLTTSPTASNIVQNKAGAATDWMKEDAALKAMLCKVNKLTTVSDADYADGNTACLTPLVSPTTQTASASTKDMELDHSPTADVLPFWNDATDTYTIPASFDTSSYRNLVMAGGIKAIFQGPGLSFKFNAVDMGGDTLTIGDGDVTVVGNFGFNSGSVITIGNGNHSFGRITVSGGRQLNIGSGNLNVTGPINMSGGGSAVRVAIGVGNTVTIGNDGTNAIYVSGGGYLCFTANCAAPTIAAGTFSANGHIVSDGGTTIIFPKATTHVINGNLSLNGNSTFGSGSYYIKGNFSNNTGGTMAGTEVSFALGGTFTLSGGTSLDLSAPTSSSSYGVPGILIATKSAAATTIGGGSQNKYAGLLYAPKSNLTISGGGSMSANGGACLMMILNRLTLQGGGTSSTGTCSGLSGSSSSTAHVALFK